MLARPGVARSGTFAARGSKLIILKNGKGQVYATINLTMKFPVFLDESSAENGCGEAS
jgi:hypothetical protein